MTIPSPTFQSLGTFWSPSSSLSRQGQKFCQFLSGLYLGILSFQSLLAQIVLFFPNTLVDYLVLAACCLL